MSDKKFSKSKRKFNEQGEQEVVPIDVEDSSQIIPESTSSTKKQKLSDKKANESLNNTDQLTKQILEKNPHAASYINERTVYVQGLPFTCEEADVIDFFNDVGEIKSIRLPRWHDSGKLKGYGHVEFKTENSAKKAMELSGQYLKNRYLTIERPMIPRAMAETTLQGRGTTMGTSSEPGAPKSNPTGCKTLFIRNLPYDVNEAEIREAFMVYGPIQTVRLAVWNHTNNLKGFGYVEYKREDSTEIAVKKSGSISIKGRIISVDYETGVPKKGYKGTNVKK